MVVDDDVVVEAAELCGTISADFQEGNKQTNKEQERERGRAEEGGQRLASAC